MIEVEVRLQREIERLERENAELRGYIDAAEESIFLAMQPAGWGRSTYQHHASRVTNIANLYLGSVHTIGQFDENCKRLEQERDDARAVAARLREVLERANAGETKPPVEKKTDESFTGWRVFDKDCIY